MSYRPSPDFDQPTAESVQRSRRAMGWVIPLVVVQQGVAIFRHDSDLFSQVMATLAWIAVTLTIMWMIFGLPMRWLSERDHAILYDEWNREISGDAARWGLGSIALIGSGMMLARIWMPLDTGMALYGLVNGAMLVAVLRYAWLNRAEPGEDE
jgi:hypothetical protein